MIDLNDDRDRWSLKHVGLDDGWQWHDGAGWYLVLDEYPEEGSCGAFKTREEAVDWVRRSGGVLA